MAAGKKQRDAVRTRRAILEAAEELFAYKGFTGTSMRDIAALAHIKAATMYHYFGSKEILLQEVFRDFYQELASLYEQVYETLPEEAGLNEGMVHFMRQHRHFIARRRAGAYLFFLETLRPDSPVAGNLKEYTADSGRMLTSIAGTWRSVDKDTVLVLLAAVIAMNVFFEIAAPYLKESMGVTAPGKKQITILAGLLSGKPF